MTAEAAGARRTPTYSYVVVWMLMIVYTLNFLDRQIVSILGVYISKDLGLTKTQFGLLGGTSFALLYTTCAIPVAYLADRGRRAWIIAGACAIWSAFTVLCGSAQNFLQILFFRMGVGFGEAGGSPPSYSLISDYFAASGRGKALAMYSLGVPVGSMLGAFAAERLADAYGWRTAFYVIGAPGIVLALLVLLVVREPKRGGLDPVLDDAQEDPPAPPFGKAVAAFFANRTLVLTAVSSAASAFVGYAALVWNPQFLVLAKQMPRSHTGDYYALILGVTGVIGTFGAGWLADALGRQDRRWFAWLPAIAFALSIPFWIGMVWAPTWQLALAFVAGPLLLGNVYLAPALTVVQNAVPAAQRTMAGALLLFILNLVGLGAGPVYIGRIADWAKPQYGSNDLNVAYAAVIPIVVLTVVAHLVASMSIARDRRLAAVLA